MLRASCLAMTLLSLPLGGTSANAPPDLSANAALMHWQAFATLPRLTDAQQKKLNAECLTMPLDAHARELVARAAYSLRLMHRGAALPRCDWAIDLEEGIAARLPHVEAARVLSSLACLRARLRFQEGKSALAIDDVIAGMALARHLSRDNTLVGLWVGSRFIEHQMRETLAQSLPKLDAKTIKALKARLDALPPGGSLAAAVRMEEKAYLEWFIRKVKETKDEDNLVAFLGRLCDSPKEARAFLKACGGTAAGVLKRAEEVRPCYALLAGKLDLPLDQFEKEFEREATKRAGNPVFKVVFPALDKMRLHQARVDVLRALLSAAVAVQLDGRDALKKVPDPVGGGPFEYAAFKGGFELRSKWKLDEKRRAKWKLDERFAKPLTLTVGQRGP